MRTISAILAVTTVLLAAPTSAQTMIAQADVEAALKGNTFDFTAQTGFTGTIVFNADMTLASTGHDGTTDTGTYRFGEGGYCSSWVIFRDGAEACFTIETLGDGRYQLYTLDGRKDDLFVQKQ